MIFGIGTDLVEVRRIESSLARHGDRFISRVLAEEELPEYEQAPHQARFLAKRFAAKEAAAKALGTGIRNGLNLKDIRVEHDTLGKPSLVFSPKTQKKVAALGITTTHLSLADEQEYAVAFVVLEGTPKPG